MEGILGKKVGMTQVFGDQGAMIPVTVLEVGPCLVVQRKTVTVLFCDVTGSTALGERLDPESLRGVMSRYFDGACGRRDRRARTACSGR